jgi:hypothetical protein
MPKRIRRPWIWCDRPANTVDGSRASPFGNPYTVEQYALDESLPLFREWVTDPDAQPVARTTSSGQVKVHQPITAEMIEAQRGKDWACFCEPGRPCHADVLLDEPPTARAPTDRTIVGLSRGR